MPKTLKGLTPHMIKSIAKSTSNFKQVPRDDLELHSDDEIKVIKPFRSKYIKKPKSILRPISHCLKLKSSERAFLLKKI